jgi:WhiB family redox-sensing transcriptional regulator
LTATPDWMLRAACRGATPVMFPVQRERIPAAKAICARCPVRPQCLDHAVTHHERWGVWGAEVREGIRAAARARKATA